jgi:hypothetical protein
MVRTADLVCSGADFDERAGRPHRGGRDQSGHGQLPAGDDPHARDRRFHKRGMARLEERRELREPERGPLGLVMLIPRPIGMEDGHG